MDLSTYFIQNEEYANQFYGKSLNYTSDYSVLKLYVNENNPVLRELYRDHIEKHNASLYSSVFPNSGFDLFIPEKVEFGHMQKAMVNLQVKCELIHCKLSTFSLIDRYGSGDDAPPPQEADPFRTIGTSSNSAFYLYPRSSITKTDLMMSNHVGIIDSGYRGFLMASVRNLGEPTTIEASTRLFQICHPSLTPIYVVMVDNELKLTPTERGEGGFGSTGVAGATNTA